MARWRVSELEVAQSGLSVRERGKGSKAFRRPVL
jgi:hypothetical protein